jgi:hypothetical protein
LKKIFIFTLFIVLTGCAGVKTQPPGIFSYVDNSEFIQLQRLVDQKVDLDVVDDFGRTPLHRTMRNKNVAAKILLSGGANPNIQDKMGFTPLHLAVYYKNSAMIIPLLMSGAKIEISTLASYWCSPRGRVRADKGLTASDLARRCHDKPAVLVFQRYQYDVSAWQKAQQEHTMASYKVYLSQINKPLFKNQAEEKLDEVLEQRRIALEEQQVCQLNQEGWYLVDGQCENDLANGQGKAVTLENKQFVGSFSGGEMVFGQLLFNDQMLWEGAVLAGKPEGEGVCIFDGSPEECKCYQGERIDSLHKQREMMVVHMTKLENQIARLQRSINRQGDSQTKAGASDSPFGYLADLNSKDKYKRTSAQIQAAIGLFEVLSK